ncbi:YhgE/Pip domain-containing protein [Streptomyces sp. LP11]|uniref:YhgE/Pip domain-containing protein n=1 Tax=Streptomyces pyxinicus TaxID=2970331 RepID=A0ABT2B6I2_9ACTN|nr:YhgE/Pip domain-containing protein [Streptomyces sp. LP11]MCS0604010.1 YhgE/Pip domain-containing protein [Streptomyces sp. LP11]
MRSPRLAALELRRFGRGKLPRAALVALLVLPLLYGALYLWSFWDPYGRLDRIPVALVNDDEGAKAGGKKLHAGDDIVAGLRDSRTFEWHEVSDTEAREGVEDGTYYLSLTLPSDLSRRIASSSGDSPEAGALRVRTNDANNYIVGQISRTVFNEVRTAASTKASRSFLDKIFVSFSGIHDKTVTAAQGADKLNSGIGKAEQGSKKLADGLEQADTASGKLTQGLAKLDAATGKLETGSGQVADGTQRLADKVNGVYAKAGPFLRTNEKAIGDTARLVADSAKTVGDNLDVLMKLAPGAAKAAHASSAALDHVYQARCEDAPVPDPACPELKRAKTAADDVATVGDDLDTLIADQRGDLRTMRANLKTLRAQALALQQRAPHLSEDVSDAVRQINKLNSGAHQVATGAEKIHTGLGSAHTGSAKLHKGIGTLGSGADSLNGGLFKLSDGSEKLAGGLHDGARKIPDYDKQDRDQHTGMMADPVQLASHDLHKAPNYGTGFAPYFIPLSLWVGAMVAYMLITPLNRRALAAGSPAWRIALAGWLPVVAIGVAQVAALMAVLHWGIGLQLLHAAGTIGFLFLVAACFAAIVQWLNARFGAAGRILVLALLMLQLTSAGGTYPVQTSPAFFNAIHPFLPMSYIVEALRRLITGGGLGPVWQACAVLAAFTAGALALTALAARRRQVWTLDRLHPELSL